MEQKKIRIRGITGTPYFFTGIRGFIDALTKAVIFEDTSWKSHYIGDKTECCSVFVHNLYDSLEKETAASYKESAELAVNYFDALLKLKDPLPQPSGDTASMHERCAERISGIKPALNSRILQIKVSLAGIDETIGHEVNNAHNMKLLAVALTRRRIEAYLHGAAIALHKPEEQEFSGPGGTEDEEETDYKKRHAANNQTRRDILTGPKKEGDENVAV